MHTPVTSLTSSGLMDPIGQSDAHTPQRMHLSGSVLGFAFRKTFGSPSRPSGR